MAQTVRDQLAREVADIEAATAVLCRAEPALESWTKAPANTGGQAAPGVAPHRRALAVDGAGHRRRGRRHRLARRLRIAFGRRYPRVFAKAGTRYFLSHSISLNWISRSCASRLCREGTKAPFAPMSVDTPAVLPVNRRRRDRSIDHPQSGTPVNGKRGWIDDRSLDIGPHRARSDIVLNRQTGQGEPRFSDFDREQRKFGIDGHEGEGSSRQRPRVRYRTLSGKQGREPRGPGSNLLDH